MTEQLKTPLYWILVLLCGISSAISCEGGALHPRISAKAAILINAKTGQVLYEKNGDEALHPASTTKILTALYALEQKGNALDALVTASRDAVETVSVKERRSSRHPSYRLEYGGTHIGIVPGGALSLRVLLYGLLLESGNDAANVIAEHVSGNVEKFVQELNAYIRERGCTQSTLANPHGLYDAQHKISARELAILTARAMHIPLFREIVRTVRSIRPKTQFHPASHFINHNALLKAGSTFYYPKATGVKRGYIEAAGHNIVVSAQDEDRSLIAVLMGASDKESHYKEVCALLDAAFSEKKIVRRLYSQGFDWFRTEVPGGKIALEATLRDDLSISYYPSEERELHAEIQWDAWRLPIAEGDSVGVLRVFDATSQLVTSAPLFAAHEVKSTFRKRLYDAMLAMQASIQRNGPFTLGTTGMTLLLWTWWISKKRKKSKKLL